MLVIAHRSGPSQYPEQTVKSALHALSLGADLVEVDVRLSKDGKLIISHDRCLERLFGKPYFTNFLTEKQFTSLKRREGGEYHGHTPQDYFDAGVFPLLFHIKEDAALPVLLSEIERQNLTDKVVIGAASASQVEFAKKTLPGIRVLAFMRLPSDMKDCILAGADYIRLWENWYSDALRDEIHAAGCKLWIMTGGFPGFDVGHSTPQKLEFLRGSNVDGILINDVSLLVP